MVDAARAEAPLGNLETAAFAQQHIGDGDTHVLHLDFHVPVRGIVITEHRQVTDDVHTRRIVGHQHHRLLRVTIGFEIGLAHHDRHFAARIAEARRPPFAAVDDVFVAIAFNAGFDVGRVG